MSHVWTPVRVTIMGALAVVLACASNGTRTVISPDGVAVQYEIFGAGEPTLVLVHGWSNNRTFWEPHTAALARSHRVVVLDLPGFGTSGTNRTSWTMELFGQDVAAVIRTLSDAKVVAVGFSMGGAAVLEAARLVPGQMSGVVLVDIFQDPNAKYSQSFIEDFVDRTRSSWHDPSTVRATGFSPETPESLIQRYIDATPSSPPDYWWPAIVDFFRWGNARLLPTLSEIEVPVVAINADQPPTNSEAWRRLVPNFKLATMTKVGHLGVIWEKTDEFDARLLDFVKGFAR